MRRLAADPADRRPLPDRLLRQRPGADPRRARHGLHRSSTTTSARCRRPPGPTASTSSAPPPTWTRPACSPCRGADAAVEPRPRDLRSARAAGLTAGYYYWDEPMTGLFASAAYDDISYPIDRVLDRRQSRHAPERHLRRPDYSTVAEFTGTSNDYHPHGNVQVAEGSSRRSTTRGQQPAMGPHGLRPQLRRERRLLRPRGPAGGRRRQREPQPGPAPELQRWASGSGHRHRALRSAKIEQARSYEHCSILKMIEWRWGLEPMTARDANAKNLAEALDFGTNGAPPSTCRRSPPRPTPGARTRASRRCILFLSDIIIVEW